MSRTEVTFLIEGMNCQHCIIRIRNAIYTLPGVFNAQIDMGRAVLTIDESTLTMEDISGMIEKAGYKTTLLSNGKKY
jgi:copper chaperone CopZ